MFGFILLCLVLSIAGNIYLLIRHSVYRESVEHLIVCQGLWKKYVERHLTSKWF